MAEKDKTEKRLENFADVFADIVNVLLFNGEQVIKPEELTFVPTFSAYRDNNKNQLQKNDIESVAINPFRRNELYKFYNI